MIFRAVISPILSVLAAMGVIGPHARSTATNGEIYIFLTGNAPYRENKHNTSRMIRDAAPNRIHRSGKPDIVVLKHHPDSLDVYAEVLKMVEQVWEARRSSFLPAPSAGQENDVVDFAFGVHMGMTTAVPEFRAEKIAYRDGYKRPGEDGVYVDEDHFRNLDLPASLHPTFDNDAAVASVKAKFVDLPLRASADPNFGFCEYRLYSSLAELYLKHKSKEGKAVFLHVPADKSPKAIKFGAEVLTAYIIALVDQLESGATSEKAEL